MTTPARLVKNSAALSLATISERVVAFILPIYIARTLGAAALGWYTVVTSWWLIFESFAYLGLDQIVMRDVARRPDQSWSYFINAGFVGAVSSLVFGFVLIAGAWAIDYPPEVFACLVVVGAFVLVFDTLSTVGEAVVKGLERMEWVLAVRFPANLIRVVLSVAALALGWGLISVFWMSGVFQVIMLLLYGLLLVRWQRPARQLFSRAMSSQIARASLVFLGISIFSVGFRYVDVILLSKATNAQEVGVYSAARKVADMVLMMSPAVMVALFPFLSRAYVASRERMADVVAQALKLIVVLLLPVGLMLWALAEPLVYLFYGEAEFEEAVSLLRILAWAVPVFFASNLLFRVLLSSDRERLTLRVGAWNAAFSLALNLLLIPPLGATGSCLAFVATALLAFVQNYFHVRRQLFSLDLLRTVGYPVFCLLGAVGSYLLAAQESPILGLLAAGLVYGGLLIVTKTITRREWRYVTQTWYGFKTRQV